MWTLKVDADTAPTEDDWTIVVMPPPASSNRTVWSDHCTWPNRDPGPMIATTDEHNAPR